MTTKDLQIVREAERQAPRPLDEITPPMIFDELRRGVLGQDRALRFAAVAIYKHTGSGSSGNVLLIGNSGTGKTTIMNSIQRLYGSIPEYRPYRVMAILNANVLVDSERTEFRGERLLAAVEQRARELLGPQPTAAELTEAMERATICIDEIDKMTTRILGRANPLGAVLQQGLLTLIEGGKVPHRTLAWADGVEQPVTLEIATDRMMFICGGAFEGLYDQVRERASQSGELHKLRTETIRTAEGRVKIMERFDLAQILKVKDLFEYGMVPQLISRFDKLVLLDDLSIPTLQQILLEARDSPFVLSRRDFLSRGIRLEMEPTAATMLAERAAEEPRSGARALRDLFTEVINPFEFDPAQGRLEPLPDGTRRLVIDAATVRGALKTLGRRAKRADLAAAVGAEEVAQLLEVDRQVDVLGRHVGVLLEPDGREVEHRLDACRGQGIVVVLGGGRRHREHADLGAGPPHHRRQLGDVRDHEVADGRAHLLEVVVEAADDGEGLVVEADGAGQGRAQVAHADHHHGPRPVDSQQGGQPFAQLIHLVADAADAELAELGEVLADLGGRQPVAVGQLLGRHPAYALPTQPAQAAQVDRETVESYRGNETRVRHRALVRSSRSAESMATQERRARAVCCSHSSRAPGQMPSSRLPPAAITAASRPQPSKAGSAGVRTSGSM